MLHTSLDLILDCNPCGLVEHVRKHLGERSADELFPITDLLDVPGLEVPDDACWALQAVPDAERMVAERLARVFACDCAERALLREREAGREPDSRSFAAIEVVRRFAAGAATSDELAAARAAAWDAARAAAWAAARAAAWAAERKWQAQHLRDLLNDSTMEA